MAAIDHSDRGMSPSQALAFVREHYQLGDAVTPLKGYSDLNFLISENGCPAGIFKVAKSSGRDQVLGQIQAMAHLARRAPQVPVPSVQTTVNGEQLVPVGERTEQAGEAAAFAYLLSYLPGTFLAEQSGGDRVQWRQLGGFLGELNRGLSGFYHPALDRDFEWDLARGLETCRRNLDMITQPDQQQLVRTWIERYQREALPLLRGLRRAVLHNDANDHNILLDTSGRVNGLIDFGDMVFSQVVFELAIAIAYAILDHDEPLMVAAEMVRGYHAVHPLGENEVKVLFHAIGLRLCVSVCMSARAFAESPDNGYLLVSQKPAWAMLARLVEIHPSLAHARFRRACHWPVLEHQSAWIAWLKRELPHMAAVMADRTILNEALVLDLTKGGAHTWPAEEDPRLASERLFGLLKAADREVAIGCYDEDRGIYDLPAFAMADGERRTIHLGIDLFQPAGSPVFAPLAGTVHSVVDHGDPGDYGPTVILVHRPADLELAFYTLYGHLNAASLTHLVPGQAVSRGQCIGWLGDVDRNGGWPAHLHFQLIGDMLGFENTFPGVTAPSERAFWRELCPDPNLILGLPQLSTRLSLSKPELQQQRHTHLGPSLSLAYQEPLHIVAGAGAHLYDRQGRAYVDCVNNVCHVGHGHPRVVAAAHAQMRHLNTNTRYLHEHIVAYAEKLLATFPKPLEVVYMVCTGSEANELAWRMAKTHTGGSDAIVVDHAYHGHTSSLIGLSPYKFKAAGGAGCPDWVQVVPMPDGYRGAWGYDHPDLGQAYADCLDEPLAKLKAGNRRLAAFFAESMLGCGGQVVLPDGYLAAAYDKVRAQGGLCIADEVQVGFGRVGSHYWAFEDQGVVPDIVTLGKPMGNGHPLAAVVTTRAVANSFANGMEYFNTFGGNPVSAAVGLAVLDVIEEEGLLNHALRVGERWQQAFRQVQERHPMIGDVRGRGLFIGLDIVRDPVTREPAEAEANLLINRMKARGYLLSTDGPHRNVVKIKPPMVIREGDAMAMVTALDEALAEGFPDAK